MHVEHLRCARSASQLNSQCRSSCLKNHEGILVQSSKKAIREGNEQGHPSKVMLMQLLQGLVALLFVLSRARK
jgi:hypothetical protein